MDKVIRTFEDLIRRNIAPSSAFFVLLLVGHQLCFEIWGGKNAERIWFAGKLCFNKLAGAKSAMLIIALFLLLLVGTSYVLATLNKVFLDNNLKKNFSGRFPFRGVNQRLEDLREAVCERLALLVPFKDLFLAVPWPSDYLLYQILRKVDKTNYSHVVDSAKSFGSVHISAVLISAHLYHYYWTDMGCFHWTSIPMILLLGFLAWQTVKSKYRDRAIRLYINLLSMTDDEINKARSDEPPSSSANDLLKSPFQVKVTSLSDQ